MLPRRCVSDTCSTWCPATICCPQRCSSPSPSLPVRRTASDSLKSLVHQGLTAPVDEHMQRHTIALAACFKSDDHREGVAAFLERRPAEFTGT